MTYYCDFKNFSTEFRNQPIQKQNTIVTHCRLVRRRSLEEINSADKGTNNQTLSKASETIFPKIQSKDDFWTNCNNATRGHHMPRSNGRRHVRYHIRFRPLSSVWNFSMLQRELPDTGQTESPDGGAAIAGRRHVAPVIRVHRTRSTPTGAYRVIRRQLAFDRPDTPKQPQNVAKAWMTSSVDGGGATTTKIQSPDSDSSMCNVCMEKSVDCALINCGHMCMCYECAVKVYCTNKVCPLCRQPIERVLRTYGS